MKQFIFASRKNKLSRNRKNHTTKERVETGHIEGDLIPYLTCFFSL